jgi:hypothetical protein
MWKIDPIQTQSLSYVHINKYILNIFPKVGLLGTKRGGKEEKNDSE